MPGKGHRHDLAAVPIIVTENVQDYRNSAAAFLRADDVVLELGCAQGCSTAVFAAHAREALGVDASDFQWETAKARYPGITFVKADAFDVMSIVALGKTLGKVFTVVAIDVSGNRQVGELWTLLTSYERLLVPRPRLFIVKSYRLLKLAAATTPFTTNASLRSLMDARDQATAVQAHGQGAPHGQQSGKGHHGAQIVVTADQLAAGAGAGGGGSEGGSSALWRTLRRLAVLGGACGAAFALGVAQGRRRAA